MPPNDLSPQTRIVNQKIWIERLVFLVTIVYAVGVLYWFHDRSWYAPDEGFYGHIADRVLAGDVPGRDIAGGHPGYDHFANAAAFAVFGKDLLSLRYPIVAMAFLSSVFVFLVLVRRSVLMGFVSAICVVSLSVVQFLNPTAHWYSFFLFAVIVGWLTWIPAAARWRVEVVGFLATTLLLFHQLNGVYVAIGLVAYLLFEAPRGSRGYDVLFARGLYAVMATGVAVYFFIRMQPFAILTYGLWPLGILIAGMFTSSVHNRDSLRLIGRLSAGSIFGVLPILIYHLSRGSVVAWLDDAIISAIALDSFNAAMRPQYFHLVQWGFLHTIMPPIVSAVPNGLFWMLLPLLPAVLGACVVLDLVRRKQSGAACAPLPFLACFYALASLRLQIPVYLFLTVAFTMAGLCWMSAEGRLAKYGTAGVLLFISVIGTIFHAGQPIGRFADGNWESRNILVGEHFSLVPANIPRATLWIERSGRDIYQWLVPLIDRETTPDETILALPYNAELYFLAGRRNAFPFASPAIAIQDQETLDRVISEIRRNPPRLVIFRNNDPYPIFNDALSNEIMGFVRQQYRLVESQFGFDVFRFSARDGS